MFYYSIIIIIILKVLLFKNTLPKIMIATDNFSDGSGQNKLNTSWKGWLF